MRPEQSNATPGLDAAKRYGTPCCAMAAEMAMPERDDTAGAGPEDAGAATPALLEGLLEPPPLLLVAFAPAAVVVGARRGGRRGRGCGGLLPACGFRCPAGLFLSDEIAQLGLGIGLGLLEVLGRLHGRFLLGDEAVGQLLGLLALAGEGVAVVVEIGDEGVELVARDIAGAQCDPGELVALEHVAQVARVLEQRARAGRRRPRRTTAAPSR